MTLSDNRRKCIALLVLRAGLGLSMLAAYGAAKLAGGQEKWAKLGGAGVDWLGIEFGHTYFGAFAAVSESIFALMVAIGLRTRSAAVCVAATMFMAWMSHLMGGDPFSKSAHAFELCIAFSAIAMLGPGRISVDGWLAARKNKAG